MSLRGKRVLVTGADGFIGSHLTEALIEMGAEVRAFCMYNSPGSLGWLDESSNPIRNALEVRLGDIRDARFVEEACRGVDIVFHLAALIAIPYSYTAPESFVDTNVKGTLNVLEAVRRAGCSRMIQTSTSEVYGTPDTLPITEGHALKGQSPYSATKIAADKLCESYHYAFETPVMILRPFNTYGPRQSARAVIPTILAQLLIGKRKLRLGNLAPRRDLTFVSDTVSGFIAAAEALGVEGVTVQLGTGRTESVEEIVRLAAQICGVDVEVEQDLQRIRPTGSEVMVLQSDASLAASILDWRATMSLEQGLAQTVEWLRGNLHRYTPEEYST